MSTVYGKLTNTNLVVKFYACVPKQWKRGLVKTLLSRAVNVCSDWMKFHSDEDKLEYILRQNGFSVSFVLNSVLVYRPFMIAG